MLLVLKHFSRILPKTCKCHISASFFVSDSSSLLSGVHRTGFPQFTRSGGERWPVSSAAFVLLPPPGAHPAAGGPRLDDHLVLGNELDADVSVLAPAGDCSGDSNAVISKPTISQILANKCK